VRGLHVSYFASEFPFPLAAVVVLIYGVLVYLLSDSLKSVSRNNILPTRLPKNVYYSLESAYEAENLRNVACFTGEFRPCP
jgi:hypothetical protein